MSGSTPVLVCIAVVLLAGCATSPRRTGSRLPDWETEKAIAKPAPLPVPAPAAAPLQAPAQTNEGIRPTQFTENWIPLAQWCAANGLKGPSRLAAAPQPTYELNLPGGNLVLRAGSRVAYLGGTQVWLGFGPQVNEGRPFIHSLDLKKTLEPLMNGTPPSLLKERPTIVIDPGHGGEDAGTRSVLGGYCEKDFTLDWARRLQLLLEGGGCRVLLTRTGDANVSLSNRIAFAEAQKADLFVSLHFNSAAPDHGQEGIETYCLTPAGEPSSLTRGFSDDPAVIFPNNAFDLRNVQIALQAHRGMLQVKGTQDRGVRRARYLTVLRGQNRAAILVEGGYLSNPHEARLIADPAHRQQLAEALARAVLDKPAVKGVEMAGRSQQRASDSQTNSPP